MITYKMYINNSVYLITKISIELCLINANTSTFDILVAKKFYASWVDIIVIQTTKYILFYLISIWYTNTSSFNIPFVCMHSVMGLSARFAMWCVQPWMTLKAS